MDILRARRLRALWIWGLAAAACLAQAQGASEATVKAAFLYKFAGYVEWPAAAMPQPDTPIVIGVMGADEVSAELEKIIVGRQVNNRRLVSRRVRAGETLRGLHILFVARAEPTLRATIAAAGQQGVLTVTEGERGLEAGSVISFVTFEDRVGFEVSMEAAERGGLRISSRMLAVARRVIPKA
jgi:hypothetical protein